jgi:DNA adenine methylase
MKYMGSKARIAKHILPIILKNRKEGQCYVEPFVGGANMIDKVDGWRIGADSNEHLILALSMIRDNPEVIPSNSSEYTKEMRQVAIKQDSMDPVDCLMYFACSFAARFKNTWAKGNKYDDFVRAARSSAMKQSPKLNGVKLMHSRYDDLSIPPKSIIYCDPPYANKSGYGAMFCSDTFWDWCRARTKEGHHVFVSEYNAPDDFVCVWHHDLKALSSRDGKPRKATEKLFIHKSQYEDKQ